MEALANQVTSPAHLKLAMSSTVHRRKGLSSRTSTTHGGHDSNEGPTSKTGHAITDTKKLCLALSQVKKAALFNGLTSKQFEKCADRASKQMKLRPQISLIKSSRCGCLIAGLKVMWLMFLMLLAIALMSAAIKPVMFYMHKVTCTIIPHTCVNTVRGQRLTPSLE